MKTKQPLLGIGLLLLVAVHHGCRSEFEGTPVIGYGLVPAHVLRVAAEEVAERGIDVAFVHDSGSVHNSVQQDLDRSIAFAANPKVIGVVGHAGSGGSLVAASTYVAEGVPNIVPNSTSRRIWELSGKIFSMVPHDSVVGTFLARYLDEELGARSVTVFFVGDEYGRGLKDGVTAELRQRGVAVVDQVPIRVPESAQTGDVLRDYESIVDASLARGVPEAALIATRSFAAAGLIPLLLDRVPGIHLVGGDALFEHAAMESWIRGRDGTLAVVDFWDPESPDPASVSFRRRFRETVGEEPRGPDALRFDALMLMATAIHEAGPNRERVLAYLASLGRDRPPYPGVTGEIRFDVNDGSGLVMIPIGAPDR